MVEFYSTIILCLKSVTHQLSPLGRQPLSPPLAKSVQVPNLPGRGHWLPGTALNPKLAAVSPYPPLLEPNLCQSQFHWAALKAQTSRQPLPSSTSSRASPRCTQGRPETLSCRGLVNLGCYTLIFLFKSQLHCLLLLTTIPKRCEL